MVSSVEARVLDHLDFQGMLDFLSRFIGFASLGGAETPAQEWVARWMEGAGLEVDVWDLDFGALASHPAYSAEVRRTEGLGVVGGIGGGQGGRTLILNGHVDVVPPGSARRWKTPPWKGTQVNGRLHGRGSSDMKGGLSCALFAAKAIVDAGIRLKGRLLVESVIGEEDGGAGTLAAILRGYRGDGAIIMEPTGLGVCLVQAGAVNFRLTVRGKAAHGCVREEGVSAIEKFWPIHRALLALEARRNHNCSDALFRDHRVPFPLSIGKVEGGDWASSVPDWLRVEGRYGLAPGEEAEAARSEFRDALARAVEADDWLLANPPELEWWGGCFLPARISPDDPVVTGLRASYEELYGERPPLKGVTFGSDMRLLVREGGTPTVLFGPGDIRQAHAVDECVPLEELEKTLRTLTLTALRYCG